MIPPSTLPYLFVSYHFSCIRNDIEVVLHLCMASRHAPRRMAETLGFSLECVSASPRLRLRVA